MQEVSGGGVYFPTRLEDIVSLYEEIARSITASYSLGYVSTDKSKADGYLRIAIEVKRPGHRVIQSRLGHEKPQ